MKWNYDLAPLSTRAVQDDPNGVILVKLRHQPPGDVPRVLYWVLDAWSEEKRGGPVVDEADIVCWMPMPLTP